MGVLIHHTPQIFISRVKGEKISTKILGMSP